MRNIFPLSDSLKRNLINGGYRVNTMNSFSVHCLGIYEHCNHARAARCFADPFATNFWDLQSSVVSPKLRTSKEIIKPRGMYVPRQTFHSTNQAARKRCFAPGVRSRVYHPTHIVYSEELSWQVRSFSPVNVARRESIG
jgi:hypothetical protein